MNNTPILQNSQGLWFKPCVVCGKSITHKYKSQLKQRTCSHSCQLKGNKFRLGKIPKNAWKNGETVGAKNVNWKGDKVGYDALHDWVKRQLGYPDKCEHCHKKYPREYLEWANLSKNYIRSTSDWIRLCKKCHTKFDDRTKGLRRWRLQKKLKINNDIYRPSNN